MIVSTFKKQIDQFQTKTTSATLLIFMHAVGVIGLLSEWSVIFLLITPFFLLLTFSLVLLNHKTFSTPFILFACIVIFASFFIEFIGVNTGKIFGNYTYGNTLGFKIGNTPLLIGILWFILIYNIGIMISSWSTSTVLKSLLGAFYMVFIDFFIEPVAIKLGFWSWENNSIPIQNYIAWFSVSFVFFLLFYTMNFKKHNPIATIVYCTQIGFFILVNLLK